ncbi:aldose epimerase family protein [Cytobacillus sp. Hz8]|uniref:aldose epimerase family protein n=1 Tax=Cytobacillus sp. Hz8 TaxID=3347168 RepID=UPI0035E38D2F
MKLTERIFGELNGRKVKAYTIENERGLDITAIEYGCTITEIKVPDLNGKKENIVLGFDTLEEYIQYSPYFGCVIGRNAGRLGQATFEMDGIPYQLEKNDGENNLHSGSNGFHHVIWNSVIEQKEDEISILFSYMSRDGEEGFPGNLDVKVVYTLTNDNELIISYHAKSDKRTIVNLTNHSYFNLSGNLKKTILNHELTIDSEGFLELDDTLIPTGKIIPVEGTSFDFRSSHPVIQGIMSEHPQTKIVGGGIDHPYLLKHQHSPDIILLDKESGRKLEIETEEPAVVFYTGNMLENTFAIRGKQSEKHLGLCLETQKLPNQIQDIRLEKDQAYTSKTKYLFS